MKKLGLIAMAALWAAGCAAPMAAVVTPPELKQPATSAYQLSGNVAFADRSVLATTAQIADKATVSLIDMASNQTVATTVTDAGGNFNLVFQGGFTPNAATTYVLEAVKGLGANSPGNKAVRLRTIVRYNSGWTSLKNAAPGPVAISAHTTALAIAAAVRTAAGDTVALSTLIGALDAGNTYTTPVTNLSATDYNDARTLVNTLVASDEDPVARIGLQNSVWVRLQDLLVLTLDKTQGNPGQPLTIRGSGFNSLPGQNSVTISGMAATVQSATQNQLVVLVPSGTGSGPVVVTVGGRVAANTPSFTFAAFALHGTQSSVLTSGDRMVLEGAFGNNNAVILPGGYRVPASREGSNRLGFRLPFDVVPGQLRVDSDGIETQGLRFDALPYAPQLGETYMHADWQTSSGRQAPKLAEEHRFGATVVSGRYVYVMGGLHPSTPTATIERALINADGSLGAFSPFTQALTAPRSGHAAVVIGKHLYVVGGLDGVEHALLDADGVPGAFSVAGQPSLSALATGLSNASVAVVGPWLYVIGGQRAGAPQTAILRAPINADGTLGAFADPGVAMGTARHGAVSAVVGNQLLVFGGYTGSTVSQSYDRFSIDGTGDLTLLSTFSLPGTPRMDATCAIVGKKLYLMGGRNSSNVVTAVVESTVQDNGNLQWVSPIGSRHAMGNGHAAHGGAIIGSDYYMFGGEAPSGPSVEHITLAHNTKLGEFRTQPSLALTGNPEGFRSVVVGKYVYLVGGASAALMRAEIDATGRPGPFATFDGRSLTQARPHATLAVIGNWLYVIGGGAPAAASNTYDRAPLGPDGDLVGNFAAVGSTGLATYGGRTGHSSAVLGNYLYLFAGYEGTPSFTATTLRAPIDASGNLGSFTDVPGYDSNNSRRSATVLVTSRRVYLIGGRGDDSLEWAEYDLNGDLVLNNGVIFQQETSRLNAPFTMHSSAVVGNKLYLFGGEQGPTDVGYATIDGNGVLGSFSSGTPLVTPHSDHASVRVGQRVYVFGGVGSNVVEEAPMAEEPPPAL